jgi:hypothetical protein
VVTSSSAVIWTCISDVGNVDEKSRRDARSYYVLMRIGVAILIAVAAMACDEPLSPTAITGLTGIVVRGPITPVCQIQVPCDAPFSASFTVEQNGRRVTEFQSNTDGRFNVLLAAGIYRIVPAANAPILSAPLQAKTVEVRPVGLTEVRLEFDTGIR